MAKLQRELGSSFKSTTAWKKKNDDLNAMLSVVHKKLWQETSHHTSEVEKFMFVVGRLEKDLARAQGELETAKKTTVVE